MVCITSNSNRWPLVALSAIIQHSVVLSIAFEDLLRTFESLCTSTL